MKSPVVKPTPIRLRNRHGVGGAEGFRCLSDGRAKLRSDAQSDHLLVGRRKTCYRSRRTRIPSHESRSRRRRGHWGLDETRVAEDARHTPADLRHAFKHDYSSATGP